MELISIAIFYLAISSYGLIMEREKTPVENRAEILRSEVFTNLIFFPSFVLMIASGIILLLYSWKILVVIFVVAALSYSLIGRFLVISIWSVPYYFLNKWAKNKEDGKDKQQ